MSTITLPEPIVHEDEETKGETKTSVKRLPPYHVVLVNDDDHSFEYVIDMLKKLFGHPFEVGERMAMKVHMDGRVIVATTSKERAELKQEQIHEFGPDKSIPRCKGSMTCEIEPAE